MMERNSAAGEGRTRKNFPLFCLLYLREQQFVVYLEAEQN